MRSTARINSWDLVDCSAEHIVGPHLRDAERSRLLLQLARSSLVWERRIAMLATFHYIKRGEFDDALRVARVLLKDGHDLIQKAVGWMLREIGKRDRAVEEALPPDARRADAQDDAAICDRAISRAVTAPVSRGEICYQVARIPRAKSAT